MARIKASNAQILWAWQVGPPTGTVLRAANDVSLNLPIATTAANATPLQMHEFASLIPSAGLFFPQVPMMAPSVVTDRATKRAIDAFRNAFIAHGLRPGFIHASLWDPTLIVVDALRKLGPDATAAQLYAYIQNVRGWTGINGPYDFRKYPERGLGPGFGVLMRWDKERDDFVPVSAVGGAPLR
jgi:branched-chain amino acid transport system substrate-binding protein